VLGAAAARPRPAWATDAGLDSQGAFMRTAADLGRLLDTLAPHEWAMPTGVLESTVYDLVRHLVGVERYVHGQLGYGVRLDAPRPDDHFRVSGMAAADLTGADGVDLARVWWREVMRTIAASAELGPDHPVAFHHLDGSLRGLLLIRTFEIWTHDEDIRRATGRPLQHLDDERLSLMSSELMAILPAGMALAGTTRPGRAARLRLTGAGAGEFVVALAPDEAPLQPDVTITVEAIELCRLAANRVSLDELMVDVDGDMSLVEPVLVGASAFALD
jgi:uncharacterized protein (TIGR03083 family)